MYSGQGQERDPLGAAIEMEVLISIGAVLPYTLSEGYHDGEA